VVPISPITQYGFADMTPQVDEKYVKEVVYSSKNENTGMFHFVFVIWNPLCMVWAICGELQNPLKEMNIASVFYEFKSCILLMQDWTRDAGIGKWNLKWWIIGIDLNNFI